MIDSTHRAAAFATRSGASDQAQLVQGLGDRLGPAVSFATTEHFNLQTARVATVSEANGRAGLYLAALSSNLIALAFVGQMSELGSAFYAFALILLPVLAFVGIVTFERLVQSSIEDIAYAHRIARLRAFYLGLAPVALVPREGKAAARALHARHGRAPTASFKASCVCGPAHRVADRT